jgi:hypothetical protein
LLVFACLMSCLLLIVNRMLVTSLYSVLVPTSFDHPKLRTVLLFVAMIALLFPQWWLIDWASDRIGRMYRLTDGSSRESDR